MLKGMGGLGDMARLMKGAQEMQAKMAGMQEQLSRIEVTGEAGAGLVRARVSGRGQLVGLDIDPSILVASEKEVVEDLIVAAIRDGQSRAEARGQQELARLAEGLGLPPGMKLPF